MQIEITYHPTPKQLKQLDVYSWPIWEKETSSFPWTYDMEEVCYILEGRVTVTPQNGEPVTIEAGQLVTFPKGMQCDWTISETVRKHYQFR